MAGFVEEIRESRNRMREDVEAFWVAGRRSTQLFGEAGRELWSAMLLELRALRELVTPARLGHLEKDLLVRLQARIIGLEERIGVRIDEIGERTDAQPIADYDRLSAKQIIAELPKLGAEEREAVVLYERTHKKRATILKAAS